MERGTIKLPEDDYERHNERRKSMGLTWAEYIDGQAPDVEERKAEALETIAGMMMMRFDYDEDMPSYSTEAMLEEARHFASGGELQL